MFSALCPPLEGGGGLLHLHPIIVILTPGPFWRVPGWGIPLARTGWTTSLSQDWIGYSPQPGLDGHPRPLGQVTVGQVILRAVCLSRFCRRELSCLAYIIIRWKQIIHKTINDLHFFLFVSKRTSDSLLGFHL